ncbi:MAG TPA: hypothetical protein VGK44_12930, partial [Casimicrobiaceae bacterium]
SLSLVSREIEIATRKGLLEPEPAVIKPTEMGRRFLNDLQQIFLPDSRRARSDAVSLVHLEATGVER